MGAAAATAGEALPSPRGLRSGDQDAGASAGAVSTAQASLYEIIQGSQLTIPGLTATFPSAHFAPGGPEPVAAVLIVAPGQLSFGPVQEVLSEPEAPARQLALLPDPPPWEMDPGPAPGAQRARRLERRRRRLGISPGQQSLF